MRAGVSSLTTIMLAGLVGLAEHGATGRSSEGAGAPVDADHAGVRGWRHHLPTGSPRQIRKRSRLSSSGRMRRPAPLVSS